MKRFERFLFYSAFFIVGFIGLTACTINVNEPNANKNANIAPISTSSPINTQTPSARTRWTVVVCSSRASEITLQAGPNKFDNQTFATWRASGGQRIYELPARVQNLSEIYFQAIVSDANPVELCVLHDGRPKKRVAFDEGSEDHEISASDDDDNDCRCTQ